MAQYHHIGPAGTGEEATCPYCKKKIVVVLSGIEEDPDYIEVKVVKAGK